MNRHPPPAASAAAILPLGVRLPWEFAFALAWLLLGLLALATATIAVRRFAGALAEPPSAAVLWSTALIVAGMVLAAARLLHTRASSGRRDGQRILSAVPPAALALFGLTMTLPGTSPAALLGMWTILAAVGAWSFWNHARHPSPMVCAGIPGAAAVVSPDATRVAPEQPAGQVVQHVERTQGKGGAEGIAGWLRVPVARGQRTVNAHVAFCPPFERVPAWGLQQVEGPQSRLRTTQLVAYGARIELKLDSTPDRPAEIVVRFEGRTESGGDATQ